jgi:hypothetical protein
MLNRVLAAGMLLALAAPAAAQNEAALKEAFEGRRVTLKMDMPGASDGVDVRADAKRAVDMNRYRNDLKRYGTAIRDGDTVTVTLVKVKKDLIEFQLAGGGYGTFGDDTSTSADLPYVEKSNKEKDLEKRIKEEDDRDKRKRLERELDDLRDRRERENRRIAVERERIELEKKERLAKRRLSGGSRFNLKYDGKVPAGIRPEDVMAALAEYVDFGSAFRSEPPAPPPPSGDITMLRKGLTRAEIERLFGKPVSSSDRQEGGLSVTTLLFDAGEQRIKADFVGDVLISYAVMSR